MRGTTLPKSSGSVGVFARAPDRAQTRNLLITNLMSDIRVGGLLMKLQPPSSTAADPLR